MAYKASMLAIAVSTAIFSGSGIAGGYSDFCTESNIYDTHVYCELYQQTDNVLDLAGITITLDNTNYQSYGLFDITNYSENNSPFIVKNLQLNDGSVSYIEDTYVAPNAALIMLETHNPNYWVDQPMSLILDNWNIELNQKINGLFSLGAAIDNGYSDVPLFVVTNSTISANADSIFILQDNYLSVDNVSAPAFTGNKIDVLSVFNSAIINTKQHVSDFGDEDNQQYNNTHLGSILNLGMLGSMLQDPHSGSIAFNFNFNNSYLEAESLVSVAPIDWYLDPNYAMDHRYVINLTNSEARFKNLITNSEAYDGWFDWEEENYADPLEINFDNSRVSSAIYSMNNGGFPTDKVTLNLTNGSVFNYLGGCTDTCNEYLLDDSGNNSMIGSMVDHYYDSYIHQLNITGNSTLAFSSEGEFKTLYVDSLNSDGSGNIVMNTNLSALQGDFLDVKQASGQFNLHVNDSGSEARTVGRAGANLMLINVKQGEANQFLLNYGNGVDIGAYVYDLKAAVNGDTYWWYLDPRTGGGSGGGTPETSPSTDAVLSTASATQLILNDELQNLRMRRGDVRQNNSGDNNVWGRFLGGTLDVDGPAGSKYTLGRAGMELGGDHVFNLGKDKLMLGVSTSLSDNKVKHARGGISKINAYGFGLYATYLADSNVYLDGVVKYTLFDNYLSAITTNGDSVMSDYKQSGIGAVLEIGHTRQFGTAYNTFIEPYGRISYGDVQGKSLTLSNGMQANLANHASLLSEIGFSSGMQFSATDNVKVAPYVKFSAEYEFIKDNSVSINEIHHFSNDFSGLAGKYGAGVNVLIGERTSVFGELNYVNGRNIEAPVNANIGVRVSF